MADVDMGPSMPRPTRHAHAHHAARALAPLPSRHCHLFYILKPPASCTAAVTSASRTIHTLRGTWRHTGACQDNARHAASRLPLFHSCWGTYRRHLYQPSWGFCTSRGAKPVRASTWRALCLAFAYGSPGHAAGGAAGKPLEKKRERGARALR